MVSSYHPYPRMHIYLKKEDTKDRIISYKTSIFYLICVYCSWKYIPHTYHANVYFLFYLFLTAAINIQLWYVDSVNDISNTKKIYINKRIKHLSDRLLIVRVGQRRKCLEQHFPNFFFRDPVFQHFKLGDTENYALENTSWSNVFQTFFRDPDSLIFFLCDSVKRFGLLVKWNKFIGHKLFLYYQRNKNVK